MSIVGLVFFAPLIKYIYKGHICSDKSNFSYTTVSATVKPFNLAALKVGDFILADSVISKKCSIRHVY